ncbi:MAG: DcrB-related protein [Blastocatellia bacterium]|nr:DcrB-related protein [Blastocatellia bacterium]
MEYRFNEASVTLPSELVDKSIQTFTLADGKQGFSIVISRADLESGETLQQLCSRLVGEWESKLPKFMLVDRQPRTLDGEAAEFFDCRWKANDVIVNQWHVVALSPKPLNALIITGTCQKNFAEPHTEIYGRLIESFHWRREG